MGQVRRKQKLVPLLLGPILSALGYLVISHLNGTESAARMGGVIILMATWWITEAVDLSITALLPIALFPLLGIMSVKEAAPNYFNQIIFLFIGGFILAFAMEKWNFHIKVANAILSKLGSSPTRLLLGFMLASYFLSMWLSNTATTMMLLPAAIAVIDRLEGSQQNKLLAVPFLLSIAYASNIGGTATLVGTPPNAFFASFYEEQTGIEISFAQWSAFAIPASLLFLAITYLYFKLRFQKELKNSHTGHLTLDIKKGLTQEQRIVGSVFLLTVLLWIFRTPIAFGSFTLPGWSSLFSNPKMIKDSSVAIFSVILLCLIPSKSEKRAIITYEEIKRLPIGMIFLFGAGFALAAGVKASGLDLWISSQLESFQGASTFIVLLALCFFMVFFTDFTSNIAAVQLILPIIIILSNTLNLDPIFLMAPVTLSASFAFLLPVSTPPNTIVYGTGRLQIKDYVKAGIFLDIIGVCLAVGSIYILGEFIFNI